MMDSSKRQDGIGGSRLFLWERQNSGTVRVGALLHITSYNHQNVALEENAWFQTEINDVAFSATMIRDNHTGFFIYNGGKIMSGTDGCVGVWTSSLFITDRRILKNGNHQICMSGSVKADDMDTCYRHHNNSIQRIRWWRKSRIYIINIWTRS